MTKNKIEKLWKLYFLACLRSSAIVPWRRQQYYYLFMFIKLKRVNRVKINMDEKYEMKIEAHNASQDINRKQKIYQKHWQKQNNGQYDHSLYLIVSM